MWPPIGITMQYVLTGHDIKVFMIIICLIVVFHGYISTYVVWDILYNNNIIVICVFAAVLAFGH